MAYAAKASGIITYIQDEDKYMSVVDKVVQVGIPLVTVGYTKKGIKIYGIIFCIELVKNI